MAEHEPAVTAAGWPALGTCPEAVAWLQVQADLGLAPRTIEAYGRGLADYFAVCRREGIEPLSAGRAEIARYVRDLMERPSRRGPGVVAFDSGVGLAKATLQQGLVAVRLFMTTSSRKASARATRSGAVATRLARPSAATASGGWCRAW